MSMLSMLGLKINKPKRFTDLNEYFFAEDQGRYLIEIERDNLDKVETIFLMSDVENQIISSRFVSSDVINLHNSYSNFHRSFYS